MYTVYNVDLYLYLNYVLSCWYICKEPGSTSKVREMNASLLEDTDPSGASEEGLKITLASNKLKQALLCRRENERISCMKEEIRLIKLKLQKTRL